MYKKVFLIIFAAIMLVVLFYFLREQQVDCSDITSTSRISSCLNEQIGAKGKLECTIKSSKIPGFVEFTDESRLRILEGFTNCIEYSGKNVEIIGQLHECGELSSCIGIGITDIKTLNLLD